nr:hypothetical protein 1769p_00115 [Serratia proteamaculans]
MLQESSAENNKTIALAAANNCLGFACETVFRFEADIYFNQITLGQITEITWDAIEDIQNKLSRLKNVLPEALLTWERTKGKESTLPFRASA